MCIEALQHGHDYYILWLTWFYLGKVVGCQIGYYGVNCTAACMHPSFGERCQGMCNCTKNICNHITGCKGNQSKICYIFTYYV